MCLARATAPRTSHPEPLARQSRLPVTTDRATTGYQHCMHFQLRPLLWVFSLCVSRSSQTS